MSSSTDRVAVVTGGTRGIGLATARSLAEEGCAVVVVGRQDQLRAQDVAAELKERYSVGALGLVADAADSSAILNVYRRVRSDFGRLDVLVNNAGVFRHALIGMISDDLVEETLAVNVSGVIHHLQAATRLMRRSGGGSIVNMTSIMGRVGAEGQVAYSASKAAVIGVTLSAAKELAGAGIRVNAVAPGYIDTDMTNSLGEDPEERLASIGMGRFGTPEDVARVVEFLASDLSEYVTGQVIGVDGGMLI